MGRRKIEIEPITDERNRTVTFIKRKAGLFKKAHELAVLCQVDVTLLILGHNNTFYEFSSVDTQDMLNHYNNDKRLLHDSKDPSFYGKNFVQKQAVSLNYNNKPRKTHSRQPSKEFAISSSSSTTSSIHNNESSSDSDDEDHDQVVKQNKHVAVKRKLLSKSDNDDHHLNKKFRIELNHNHHQPNNSSSNNNNHSTSHIQNRVQKQFKDLHHKNSVSNIIDTNISPPPSNDIKSSPDSIHSSSKKLSNRPVLRVKIPQNNVVIGGGDTIKSEPSPATNQNVYGNTSPQHYKNTANSNIKSNTISPTTLTMEQQQPIQKNIIKSKDTTATTTTDDVTSTNSKTNLKIPTANTSTSTSTNTNTNTNTNSNFSFNGGLPPLSAMSPYIATPLQSSNFHSINNKTTHNNNSNNNNSSSNNPISPLIPSRSFNLQQQTHSQRYTQQQQIIPGRSSSPLNATYPSQDPANGSQQQQQQQGNLPSKYVNDLMIPSPTVFQDWNFSLPSAGPLTASNQNQNPNSSSNNNNNKFVVPTSTTLTTNNTLNQGNSSSTAGYDPSNGNTGLTPYIGTGQTPLTNRFFNFPTSNMNSPDNDKKIGNNTIIVKNEDEDKDK